MWQRRPRRAATDLRRSPTRRAAGWRGSRRLMVRTAALQAAYAGSSPAGNASTHLAVARHGKRTWFGTTKPQVRILPARPTDSPVAQWIKRARGYDPRGRGFESLPGCQHMAPYLRRKSPRLSSGSTRVQVPPAPPLLCRAASSAADPYVSARSSTAREQPALNRQVAGSTPAAPTNECSVSSVEERPPYKREVDGSFPSPSTNTLLKLI